MAETPQWRLVGDWFDVCNCTIPCPCTFAQAPSEGDCEGVLAWHIKEGSFGDVTLDDLNVVALGALTGPTTPEGKRVQVHNPPGAEVGPGQTATWGVATADRAEGFGFKWEWDGRSSKHFPFDWSGPDD